MSALNETPVIAFKRDLKRWRLRCWILRVRWVKHYFPAVLLNIFFDHIAMWGCALSCSEVISRCRLDLYFLNGRFESFYLLNVEFRVEKPTYDNKIKHYHTLGWMKQVHNHFLINISELNSMDSRKMAELSCQSNIILFVDNRVVMCLYIITLTGNILVIYWYIMFVDNIVVIYLCITLFVGNMVDLNWYFMCW